MQIFGERFDLLCAETGKMKKDIATELGVSYRQLCRYVNGEIEPPYERLVVICRYFSVSADYLLGIADER